MTTTTAAMEGRNPLSIFVDSILGTDKNYSMKRNLKYVLNFKMKARDVYKRQVKKQVNSDARNGRIRGIKHRSGGSP